MDIRYRIEGGHPLTGEVAISGSKNAALPLIAATLLADGETVLTNMPRLRDTIAMVRILEFLGVSVTWENDTMRVNTKGLQNKPIPHELVSRMRGSIVFLGPLLARFGVVEMAYPGGCVLGKRPVGAHVVALAQLGAADMSSDTILHLQGNLQAGRVILPEFSVTTTENVLMAAALLPGKTRIDMAAAEPHVQDLCKMLVAMGVAIDGIGSHTLIVHGVKELLPVTHRVTSDYLEAGILAIAGLITRGNLTLTDVDEDHLVSFLSVLRRVGGKIESDPVKRTLTVNGDDAEFKATSVQTNIFPGFPTDLQAPMGVMLTQAQGVSRIFEVLFEGRMAYLYELEKMGAHIEILNAHQALIIGPKVLQGRTVASNDIRAGAAMVLAALCAEGQTTVTDVHYIERGYDQLDQKLRSIGAKIERTETATQA